MTKTNDKTMTAADIKRELRSLSKEEAALKVRRTELFRAKDRLETKAEKAKGWRIVSVWTLRRGMELFTCGSYEKIVSLRLGGYQFGGGRNAGQQRAIGLANGKTKSKPMDANVKVRA